MKLLFIKYCFNMLNNFYFGYITIMKVTAGEREKYKDSKVDI